MSCPGGIEPLLLPISNVTVTSDGRAVARGVEFGIGTPQQIVSLQLMLFDKDLFGGGVIVVVNSAECTDTDNKCAGDMGGVFDSSASDTFTQVTKAQWNGTDESVPGDGFIFFNDKIHYGSSSTNDGFPMLMNSPGGTIQGGLPLGPNSTFLQTIYDSQMAPSTAYGLYPGSRSISDQSDGLLIVGGYDASLIDGELTVFDYDPDCPQCVEIKSISYETADSSTTLLDEPLLVALESYRRTLMVPQAVYDTFQEITGSTYDLELDMLVHPPNEPLGDLVVTLSNGFTSTIPANELFTKPRLYNDDGLYEITDHDTTFALLENYTDTAFSPDWGLPYLSQHYLVVDHALQEWQMGKAKKASTAQDILNGFAEVESDLRSICAPKDSCRTNECNPGPSAAMIAGIVVGAVAFLALVGGGVWFFFRRRRQTLAAAGGAGSAIALDKKEGSSQENLRQSTMPPPSYQPFDTKHAAIAEMASPIDGRGPASELASPEPTTGQAPWRQPGSMNVFEAPGAAARYEMESPVVGPGQTAQSRHRQQQVAYEMP